MRRFLGLLLGLLLLVTGCAAGAGVTDSPAATATSAAATASHGASARWTASGTPTTSHRPSHGAADGLPTVPLADLPAEARTTVRLIHAGGPFPYSQDGVTYHNYNRLLPRHPDGWYHEYTVRTPGERSRGARRIITGRDGVLYWTPDHYSSFARIT